MKQSMAVEHLDDQKYIYKTPDETIQDFCQYLNKRGMINEHYNAVIRLFCFIYLFRIMLRGGQ